MCVLVCAPKTRKEKEIKGFPACARVCVCMCEWGGSGALCTTHHQTASSNSTARLGQGQFHRFRAPTRALASCNVPSTVISHLCSPSKTGGGKGMRRLPGVSRSL